MSTLKEFLFELSEELRFLPPKQVNEVLRHYRDKVNVEVDYGTPEEKVIATLKTPKEIAEDIYKMHGVNYLEKRKKHVAFKETCLALVYSIVLLLSIVSFIVLSIFIIKILINMFNLIIHCFSANQIIDKIISSLCVFSYFVVMMIFYIFIVDLFLIIFSTFIKNILHCFDKTRNKHYPILNFTINGWLNVKTEKPKILIKTFGITIGAFVFLGICSYFTKGYIYRSIKNINANSTEISEKFQNDNCENIEINGLNAYVVIDIDDSLLTPKIIMETEFSNSYTITVDATSKTTIINIKDSKTYDLIGILKAPTTVLKITLPKNKIIENLNLNVKYGKVITDGIDNIENLKIDTIAANISLNNSKFTNLDLSAETNDIVVKDNSIVNSNINSQSGSVTCVDTSFEQLIHNNGSSKVQMINCLISNYTLKNQSGTIYLERLNGKNINVTSRTSLNEYYDLYYDDGIFEINSTGSLKLTRAIFKTKLSVKSENSSHQVLSYVTSPIIDLNATTGQIILEKINAKYSLKQIESFDEDYQKYIQQFNNAIDDLNALVNLKVKSIRANVSFSDSMIDILTYEITSASTAIENIKSTKSDITLKDTGAKINEFYGSTINLILSSSSYNSMTSVEFYNKKESNMKVSLTKDGMSELLYENIEINKDDN